VRLKGDEAGGAAATINWVLTDTDERLVLRLSNGTLSHVLGATADDADTTLTLTRAALNRFILGTVTFDDLVEQGEVTADPGLDPLHAILALLDDFDLWFNIIEP